MRGVIILVVVGFLSIAALGQTDKEFFKVRQPWRQFGANLPGTNPVYSVGFPNKPILSWGISLHNYFGIADFNAFEGGVQYASEKMVFGISAKHSSLYDIGYSRELVILQQGLYLSKSFFSGLSIICYRIGLPENLGSALTLGGAPIITYTDGKKLSFSLSGGAIKTIHYNEITLIINSALCIRSSKQVSFALEAESISGKAPVLFFSVLAEPVTGAKFSLGASTGPEVLKIGLCYNLKGIYVGAATTFHQYYSRSYTLSAAGNHIRNGK